MIFNSLQFVAFFIIVYFLYRALNHRWQNRMLLAASYFFYAFWDWRFLSLIMISTAVDYVIGLKIYYSGDKRERNLLLLVSLIVNLGILGFFKYFNFFIDNLQSFASLFGFHLHGSTMQVILPVGISFYTFQTMSYTIDVYRNQLKPERNFLDFALFVAFFPQLVAGPIERASRLLPQITKPRMIRNDDIKQGIWLIFWGYFLKIFVADNLAVIADRVFATPAPANGWEVLIGVYAFAFQIFGDFAGYSSIAIGIAMLMGFQLMTNFLYPYFVTNPRDFWRNWHISLSTWLRDYLYISLGGNRGTQLFAYRNIFLTMVIGGLWHGAAWTYVLWGIYHGVILIVHRVVTSISSGVKSIRLKSKAWYGFKIFIMFHITCFGWMIFRSNSIEQMYSFTNSLITDVATPSLADMQSLLQILFYIWLVVGIQLIQKYKSDILAVISLSQRARVAIVMAMYCSILVFGNFGGKEFVYFQF